MAEEDSTDDSQKTEDPTPRKLEEARKRGQVVLSREVNNWIILFAGTLILALSFPSMMSDLKNTLTVFIARPDSFAADAHGLQVMGENLLFAIAKILALPFGVIFLVSVLAPFVQIGPLFTAEPLKPSLSKISMIKGVQRLFSSRAIAEFLKGLIKLVIVAIVGVLILMPYFGAVEHFVGLSFGQTLFELHSLMIRLMIGVLAVLLVVAVLDYMYQRHEHMKKLRMSKQEIKDEFKQSEGDPQIKARLRELREQKARQRMMQAVPEADVVITNPTHYAVALKYDTAKMDAPVMVAKGVDTVAERIKDLARENKVPVIENAPLARALFDSMEIDQMIPQEHYKAVAEVISYIFKLKNRR